MQEGGYEKVEAEAPRTWWGWGSSSTSSADLSTSATQPPSSGGVVFYPPWRTEVLRQVNVRDGLQRRPFVDLIRQQHVFVKERAMMRDKMYMLDKEVLHLKQLIGELKRPDGDTTAGDGDVQRLQQELTECYKRNSETAQEVIELNRRVKELTETLNAKQDQLAENERICEALKDELRGKVGALRTLTPELESLKAELARSEDRNKKLEEENAHMLTQWKLKNSEDARKMNEVNEFFQQMQHMQHLAKNPPGHSSDSSIEAVAAVGEDRRKGRAHAGSSVPRRAATQLRAHTGDVTSVAYSASGDRIASGSTDMTVKIWGLNGDLQSTLTGAKLAITQVEFAPEDRDLVLASSCDNVARVWSVSSGKVKHTLRGHVAKVTGSTFMSAGKVITGSHDRTVKVWDLDKGYCVRTVFCYNPCNAVAFVGRSLLCSAHVDRRIRLWTSRPPTP